MTRKHKHYFSQIAQLLKKAALKEVNEEHKYSLSEIGNWLGANTPFEQKKSKQMAS